MNSQTAAVIDFQKPLKLEANKNVIKVSFASYIEGWRKDAICKDMAFYYKCFVRERPNCPRANERRAWYKGQYLGLISALHVLGSISFEESQRLIALSKEQSDLFDEQQAA